MRTLRGADGSHRLAGVVAPARGAEVGEAIARAVDAVWFLDWGGGLVWVAVAGIEDRGAVVIRAAIQRAGRTLGTGHATLIKGSTALRCAVPVFEAAGIGVSGACSRPATLGQARARVGRDIIADDGKPGPDQAPRQRRSNQPEADQPERRAIVVNGHLHFPCWMPARTRTPAIIPPGCSPP